MDKQELIELIERYHDGRATPAEKYVVESLLASLLDDTEEAYTATQDDIEALQQQIMLQPAMPGGAKPWHQRSWVRICAAAFVLLGASLFIKLGLDAYRPLSSGAKEGIRMVSTGVGQVKRLVLSDSTEIYLNANSSVEINGGFGKDERFVKLLGEAHFNVRRNTLIPFTVKADELEVKVLGTAFNINAYRKLNTVQVSVETGQVQVSEARRILGRLKTNEQLVYEKTTASYHMLNGTEAGQSSWKEGVSVLNRASFQQLALVIYNHYGLWLESTDAKVLNSAYTFTVRTTRTSGQTLGQLCEMIHKRYKKEGDRLIIY